MIGMHLRTQSVLLPIISCQLKLNLFIVRQLKKFRFQKQKPQGNNVTLIRAISIHTTGFQQPQKAGKFPYILHPGPSVKLSALKISEL